MTKIANMEMLQDHATYVGNPWFSEGTMSFFKTKLYPNLVQLPDNGDGAGRGLFITSEKRGSEPRRFTVRIFVATRDTLSVDTIGEFQEHAAKKGAESALKRFAEMAKVAQK